MRRKSIKKVATLAVTGALVCANTVGVVAAELPVDENQGTEAEPQDLVKIQCAVSVLAKVSYTGENAPALLGDDFTFELRDAQGTVVSTAKNDIDGTVKFDLTCDTEGVFGYTIVQVAGTDTNITYDSTITNVAVNVTKDEAGNLAATVDYGLPEGEEADPTGVYQANDFVNVFGTSEGQDTNPDGTAEGDVTTTPDDGETGEETGDETGEQLGGEVTPPVGGETDGTGTGDGIGTTTPTPTPEPENPNYNKGYVNFPVPTSYVFLDGNSVNDSNLNLIMRLATFKQTQIQGTPTSNKGKVAWASEVIRGLVPLTGKTSFTIEMVRADRTDNVLYDNQFYEVEYEIYNGEIRSMVIKDSNENVVEAPIFNCIQTGYGKNEDTSTSLGGKVECTKGSITENEYIIQGTLTSGTPNNVSNAGNNFEVGNKADGTFSDEEIAKKFPTTPGKYEYDIIVKPSDPSKTIPIEPPKRTLTVYVNPNEAGETDYTFQVDGEKGNLTFTADDKNAEGTETETGKLDKLVVDVKNDKGESLGEGKATATFTPTDDPSKAFTQTNDAAGEFPVSSKLPTTPGKYEYTVSVGVNGEIPGYTSPVVAPDAIKVTVFVSADGKHTFNIEGDKEEANFIVSEGEAGNEEDFKLFSTFFKNVLSNNITMKNGDKDMKGVTGEVTVKVSVGGALAGKVEATTFPVVIKDGSVVLNSAMPEAFGSVLDAISYDTLKGKSATLTVDVTPLEIKGSDELNYKTESSGSDFITIDFPEVLPAPDKDGNFNLSMKDIDGNPVTKASDMEYIAQTELTDEQKTEKFVDAMTKLFNADFRLTKTKPTVSNATDLNQGILDGSVTAKTKVKVTFDDFLKSQGIADYETELSNNQGKDKENTLSVFDKFKDVLKEKGYKAFEGKEFSFSIDYVDETVKGSDKKDYKRVNQKGTWKVRFDKPDSVTVVSAPGVYATNTDAALKFTGFFQQDGELSDEEKTDLFVNTLNTQFRSQFRLSKTAPKASDYKTSFGILDGSVTGQAKVKVSFDDTLNALGIKDYEMTLRNYTKDNMDDDVFLSLFGKYTDTVKTLGWKQFEGKEVSFKVEFPDATIKGSDGKTYYANNTKGTWKVKFEAPDKLTVISHPTLLDDNNYSAIFSQEDPSKEDADNFDGVDENLTVKVDKGELEGGEIQVTIKPDDTLKDFGATDIVSKNDADGNIKVEDILVPKKEGTYTYEVVYKDPDNLECKENIKKYTITFVVKKNDKGEFVYDKVLSKDDKDWDGSRDYVVKDTGETEYKDAKINLVGKVNLKNGKEGIKFKFTLTKGNNTISSVESSEDGTIEFPQLKLNKEGTYTLMVNQIKGSDSRITYDTKPVKVVIKVAKDEEKKAYTYKITYTKDGKDAKGIVFDNVYNANGSGTGNNNPGANQGTANTIVTLVRSQALESYLNQISGETGRVTSNQHTMSFQLTATNNGNGVQAMTYVRAKLTGGMTLATSAMGGKMVSANGSNYIVWEIPTLGAGATSALSATLNVPANASDGRADYGIDIEYLPLDTADANYMNNTNWVSADSLTFYQTGKGTGATAQDLAQNGFNGNEMSLLSAVSTGDNTPIATMLSLLGVSVAGLLGGLFYKKKRDREDAE